MHLKVAGQDFHNHLRQVHLRPAILVLLLTELFERKHEAFLRSAAGQTMDMDKRVEQMKADVYRLYPETEDGVPLIDRKGVIPTGIREELETAEQEAAESPAKKRKSINVTKNATPGDISMTIDNCLEDIRPKAFCLDANPSDSTTPDVLREGGLERYSDTVTYTFKRGTN